MHHSLVDRLACPGCRHGLRLVSTVTDGADILAGTLFCDRCGVQVRIVRGFALFTEADIEPPAAAALAEWFGSASTYQDYRQSKFSRNQLEIYAAFHPFNESVRAAEAALPAFAAGLAPGIMILDPWARTGWSGFWLAERFPEQRVVMLVEGNRDVLGYRGVAHWLAQGVRPANLDVLFVHPAHGLPFKDATFAGVWSHDALHRFPVQALAAELLRVSTPAAPLVLAHVHLANSEPDPWFDRGCSIRHGRSYRRWLDTVCHGGPRRGWVFSEADLFTNPAALPADSPDTSHYNGFILIAVPGGDQPAPLSDTRYLLNPLFRLHLGNRSARIENGHLDGMIGELLDRHPIYARRLPKAAVALAAAHWALIALALVGQTHLEILNILGADAAAQLALLIETEILLPAPVSLAGQQMQRFHANQLPPAGYGLAALIAGLAGGGAELRGGDGTSISGTEIPDAIEGLAAALAGLGARPGMTIELALAPHPLALLVLLAGLRLGCDVSACAGELGSDMIIADSVEGRPAAGVRCIAMGWNGEAGSVIAGLESAATMPAQQPGCVVIGSKGNRLRLPADLLCEAALSMRNAAAPLAGIAFQTDSFEGLLACLVAVGRGEAITLSV